MIVSKRSVAASPTGTFIPPAVTNIGSAKDDNTIGAVLPGAAVSKASPMARKSVNEIGLLASKFPLAIIASLKLPRRGLVAAKIRDLCETKEGCALPSIWCRPQRHKLSEHHSKWNWQNRTRPSNRRPLPNLCAVGEAAPDCPQQRTSRKC